LFIRLFCEKGGLYRITSEQTWHTSSHCTDYNLTCMNYHSLTQCESNPVYPTFKSRSLAESRGVSRSLVETFGCESTKSYFINSPLPLDCIVSRNQYTSHLYLIPTSTHLIHLTSLPQDHPWFALPLHLMYAHPLNLLIVRSRRNNKTITIASRCTRNRRSQLGGNTNPKHA